MLKSRTLLPITAVVICLAVSMVENLAVAQDGFAKKYTETVATKTGEKISFDMVLIPAGNFRMGSPANEAGRKDDEAPRHEVRVDNFYFCTTETTIELFMAYYQETVSAKKDFITTQEQQKKADSDVDAITGPTPAPGNGNDLAQCYDVLPVAFQKDGKGVSAADGGRMGVRLPGWFDRRFRRWERSRET